MQGSLWRQRIGSDEARQLTDGPGYDYQPDWSPDGRRIVYASYRNDADRAAPARSRRPVRLRSLLADGAVNLEPRWSPDGRRLAFVSTAYEGRWHVFAVDGHADGKLGTRRSASPRTTTAGCRATTTAPSISTSRPTWSPDGSELILVSNRGPHLGLGRRSGGWRRARAAPTREIRVRGDDLEGAARLVARRQARGLQLVPRPAVAPALADDGRRRRTRSSSPTATSTRRAALVARRTPHRLHLERGRQHVALGGRRAGRAAAARSRGGAREYYRTRSGGSSSLVIDAPAVGRCRPGSRSTGPDGRSFAPDDAWRHADDGFDRRERRFEYGYFHTAGPRRLTAPAGAVHRRGLPRARVPGGPADAWRSRRRRDASRSGSPLRR